MAGNINKISNLFLESVKAALAHQTVDRKVSLEESEWTELFQLAAKQSVLPLVYQSVCGSESFQTSGRSFVSILKKNVFQEVVLQVRKTEEFLSLYKKLTENGLQPIVVKGITCRNLYPEPDNRPSSDEDLFIPEGTYEQYHQALLKAGMEVAEWDAPHADTLHEISYVNPPGVLRIELHKTLFETELDAHAGMNERFIQAFENSIQEEMNGVAIRTMDYSDHLLFLILHAFKHFIGSGFGIRQVCDLVMFANAYGRQIDWKAVQEACEEIHADVFAASLFDIGRCYLNFDEEKAAYPEYWKALAVDSEDLLIDLLDAGVFGASDMSRKHSSNITLSAIAAQNQGKKAKGSVLKTIFPSAKALENRYPYLKKHKYLLPVAWGNRILQYGKEIRTANGDNDAMSSIKIGNQRMDLMKKYRIIEK